MSQLTIRANETSSTLAEIQSDSLASHDLIISRVSKETIKQSTPSSALPERSEIDFEVQTFDKEHPHCISDAPLTLLMASEVDALPLVSDILHTQQPEAPVEFAKETTIAEPSSPHITARLAEDLKNKKISESDCLCLIRNAHQNELDKLLQFLNFSPARINEPNRYTQLIQKANEMKSAPEEINLILSEITELRKNLSDQDYSPEFIKELDEEIKKINELVKQAKGMCSEAAIKPTIKNLATDGITHFYINTINSASLHKHIGKFNPHLQVCYLINDIDAFLAEKPNLPVDQREKLEHLKKNLIAAKNLIEFDVFHNAHIKSEENEEEKPIENLMHEKIEELSTGESCVFCGGGKDHAFVYEVTKIDEDKYSFNIINTGEDESEFKIWMHRKQNLVHKARHKIPLSAYEHLSYEMPLSVLSPEFLKSIALSTTRETPTPRVIRQIRNRLETQRSVVRKRGREHKPQKNENCSSKSLMSLMHGRLIRELGDHDGKKLFLEFKSFKGARNYSALIELLDVTPAPILKEIFQAKTDEQLNKELSSLHRKSQSILTHWERKYNAI